MKILAIESSCDETAAAVVEDGRKVLSNIIASQVESHIVYGGVVPEIASRMHCEAISSVVREALEKAQTNVDDIDAIGVTYAPGLIGALLVGTNFAKGLAYSAGKPLIPTHHLRSHIAANYITSPELEPPFLCLVVSGGHSHIVAVNDYTDFKVIGKTRDDAAGECLDKTARAMGLDYPGGKNLDIISKNGNPYAYKFPHPKTENEYDFSFSGLKTAVINTIHNQRQKGEEPDIADLGASTIWTVADILTGKLMAAAEEFGFDKIALAGGVSANSKLRERVTELCEEKGFMLYLPALDLCGDNAAMVGSQSYYEFIAGNIAGYDLNSYATMPLDNAVF